MPKLALMVVSRNLSHVHMMSNVASFQHLIYTVYQTPTKTSIYVTAFRVGKSKKLWGAGCKKRERKDGTLKCKTGDHASERRKGTQSQLSRRSFPRLRRPAFYILAFAADLESVDLDAFHARRVLQPSVRRHSTCVGAFIGDEFKHGTQKGRDALGLVLLEMVLFAQHIGEGPVT